MSNHCLNILFAFLNQSKYQQNRLMPVCSKVTRSDLNPNHITGSQATVFWFDLGWVEMGWVGLIWVGFRWDGLVDLGWVDVGWVALI